MTKAEIRELARFYLSETGTSWYKNTTAGIFDIDDALVLSLQRYYRETKCSMVNFTLAATADQEEYAYTAFHADAARIFDISYISYDGDPLTRINRGNLDRIDSKWRTAASGTPRYWLPWGDKKIRIYKPPSGTLNLYLEGWETPASTVFDGDSDTPPIDVTDHPIIAKYAAVLGTIRDVTDENQMRQNVLYKEVLAGWQAAYKRIHGIGDETIIFGRNAGSEPDYTLPYNTSITNI